MSLLSFLFSIFIQNFPLPIHPSFILSASVTYLFYILMLLLRSLIRHPLSDFLSFRSYLIYFVPCPSPSILAEKKSRVFSFSNISTSAVPSYCTLYKNQNTFLCNMPVKIKKIPFNLPIPHEKPVP